jgi:hypothetical protein
MNEEKDFLIRFPGSGKFYCNTYEVFFKQIFEDVSRLGYGSPYSVFYKDKGLYSFKFKNHKVVKIDTTKKTPYAFMNDDVIYIFNGKSVLEIKKEGDKVNYLKEFPTDVDSSVGYLLSEQEVRNFKLILNELK